MPSFVVPVRLPCFNSLVGGVSASNNVAHDFDELAIQGQTLVCIDFHQKKQQFPNCNCCKVIDVTSRFQLLQPWVDSPSSNEAQEVGSYKEATVQVEQVETPGKQAVFFLVKASKAEKNMYEMLIECTLLEGSVI